jgi:hypothetical protein
LREIQPNAVESLPVFPLDLKRLNDAWPRFFSLQASKESRLVQIETLITAFLKDLASLRKSIGGQGSTSQNVDFSAISYYLGKILSALADEQGRLVLGGGPIQYAFARGLLTPNLVQDFLS